MRFIRLITAVLFIAALCSAAAAQAGLTVKVGDVTAAHRQLTEVPIKVVGASNLGSLHIELVYDPAVLDPLEVKAGALAVGAMKQENLDTPGRVVIGLISAQGINGDGPVAVVSFDVLGDQGDTSPLTLQNVQASDASTLAMLPTTLQSGTFTVGAGGGGTSVLLVGVFAVILLGAVLIIWQVGKGRSAPAAVSSAAAGGRLWVTQGSASPATLSLNKPVVVLGREQGNDLVVHDDLASRQHAQIRQEGQGWVLYDLNSTNGTFVNGQQIAGPHVLRPGDRLGIGNVELAFGE
ncbi:MAG TPA: FHA domain-containing protein [Anaerolineae bacterium]|nr:FHA domain-containing protein [Anaerolineae bacterium]